MKKLSILIFIAFLTNISCKDKTEEKPAPAQVEQKEFAKTYAEISIKEGGQWEGKKYVGDDFSFKNVNDFKAPDSLTDHSYYLRYEGPGWESNKVGFRIYFDWRNAIDIFGKKVDTMVLSEVGQDNYDSYHEDAAWGQDILKAGQSLGLGSYGMFDGKNNVVHFKEVDSTTAKIENTANASGVTINYYGWKALETTMDLKAELFIEPDSRMTEATLTPSKKIEGLTTGMVKFDGIDLITPKNKEGEWGYIATYGEQTLVPDDLGMAIFYKRDAVEELLDSEFDHLVLFKPTTAPITYYFAAAWEKEKNGIKNKEEFVSYLDATLADIN